MSIASNVHGVERVNVSKIQQNEKTGTYYRNVVVTFKTPSYVDVESPRMVRLTLTLFGNKRSGLRLVQGGTDV